MRSDIAQRWAEELRSGKYAQGRARLRKKPPRGPEQFCCLGVLCEIAVADGVIEPGSPSGPRADGSLCWMYGKSPEMAYLPREVVKWAKMDSDQGLVGAQAALLPGEQPTLADMNDLAGADFEKIADFILKHQDHL